MMMTRTFLRDWLKVTQKKEINEVVNVKFVVCCRYQENWIRLIIAMHLPPPFIQFWHCLLNTTDAAAA